jgi:predicted short-subunit dehydrogenase-like oxidoreductase (DUF2520 family)
LAHLQAHDWSKKSMVLLAVPEDSLEELCNQLKAVVQDETGKQGPIIAHTSGALSHAVFASYGFDLERCASIHPVFPFPCADTSPETGRVVHGISGSAAAQAQAAEIVGAIGGRFFSLNDTNRTLYHLACVLASNHVVTLAAIARRLGAEATDDQASIRIALDELMLGSVENLRAAENPGDALSGPVARGDHQTLKQHIQALGDRPDLSALYLQLIKNTIDLAPHEHQQALSDFIRLQDQNKS